MPLHYELKASDGRARRGTITMSRGTIETPVFMPVGTAGTIKGLLPSTVKDIGTQISLANTYHMHLTPGEAIVAKHGGLHEFMQMPWPLLTDSGGFQVFSLPKKEIAEQGVTFEFKKGAKPILATPEWSMQVQMELGADIIMAFDECAPYPCTEDHAERAMQRTLRWLDRCIEAHTREDQCLFGIVQGSVFSHLRQQSALETIRRDLPGYAIGGVSVGEGHTLMMKAVDDAEPWMPADKPRYLMGVGLPEDIVGAVGRGVDMFDCVIPTRYGRSGTCFTRRGRIRLTDRGMCNDMYPIDPECGCYACTGFTRSYIHHLLKTGELLGTILCTLHNVAHYHDLMARIRAAIEAGEYNAFAEAFEQEYIAGDRARRREEFEEGLYETFAVGFAEELVRRDDLRIKREQDLARRNPDTRDSADIAETETAPRRDRRTAKSENESRGGSSDRGASKDTSRDGGRSRRGGRGKRKRR